MDDNFILPNNSFVIIPNLDGPAIINIGKKPINIENIDIVLDFGDDDKYEKLLSTIKNNASFEYIIIDGEYIGGFSNISLLAPSKFCEKIDIIEKKDNENNIYSIAFNIDSSSCSKLKWWGILLICIGILVILSIIFIIVLLTNKSLRRKILPYRDRRKNVKE